MAHIDIPSGFPGIAGLMKYQPDTGKLLLELSETLLRGDSPFFANVHSDNITVYDPSFLLSCEF
ncbi:hypothetical protein [Okeania sp. SIO2C2]|uniref:hypothetical protein n=1 Tax=Okeania sp. SIO2C2 TaxID=2607787 RepID=UPI002579A63A|nr:hypothetical protein [Okeania sp. SIO2C2]